METDRMYDESASEAPSGGVDEAPRLKLRTTTNMTTMTARATDAMTTCDVSVSLQYIDDLINKFSAQDETFSVTRFIEEIDENATIFGWTPLQQLIVARRSMTGTAALWLQAERPFKSWDDLKYALKEEFHDTIDIKAIHELMAARKKKVDESCLDYLFTMRELGNRGKMPDDVAIQYIVDGIEDVETNKMILYGVTTYDDLKAKMRIYELIKNKKLPTHLKQNEMTKNRHIKPVSPRYKMCYSCGEEEIHVSSMCPNQEKGTKCFQCNQFGHISAHCCASTTSSESESADEQDGGTGGRATSLFVQTVGHIHSNEWQEECFQNERSDRERQEHGGKDGGDGCQTSHDRTDIDSCDSSSSSCDRKTNNQNIDRKPIKKILLCNRSINALIDSGSDVNLVSEDSYELLGAPGHKKCELSLTGLGASKVVSPGYVKTNIAIDDKCCDVVLHLVPKDMKPYDIILGQDFLYDKTVVMNSSQLFKREESYFHDHVKLKSQASIGGVMKLITYWYGVKFKMVLV